MSTPHIPGSDGDRIELPCGRSIEPTDIDLGMREIDCTCGEPHAVVLDVHPPARFVPETMVEVLEESIGTEDDFGSFGTPHLLGLVIEEFPNAVTVHDAGEDGRVGYALCWVTEFDARRLHEIIVELLVELMDHAVSHADDESVIQSFEDQLSQFDVEAFVDEYRAARNLEDEFDEIP